MQIVTVCRSCGRTIEKEFVYCPWCGLSQVERAAFDEDMDNLFDKLEKMQQEDSFQRISKMNRSLDMLESDLLELSSTTEVGK